MNYGYDNGQRRSSLSLLQPNAEAWAQSYLNDTLGRLPNLVSPAGVFGYRFYRPPVTQHTTDPDNPIQTLAGGAAITNGFDAKW